MSTHRRCSHRGKSRRRRSNACSGWSPPMSSGKWSVSDYRLNGKLRSTGFQNFPLGHVQVSLKMVKSLNASPNWHRKIWKSIIYDNLWVLFVNLASLWTCTFSDKRHKWIISFPSRFFKAIEIDCHFEFRHWVHQKVLTTYSRKY